MSDKPRGLMKEKAKSFIGPSKEIAEKFINETSKEKKHLFSKKKR